jgi:hypothetical protein
MRMLRQSVSLFSTGWPSAGKPATKPEITDLDPWIWESRPDAGGHSGGIASRPWRGFDRFKDSETAPGPILRYLAAKQCQLRSESQARRWAAQGAERLASLDDGGILPWFDRKGDKAPIESGMRAGHEGGVGNCVRAGTQWRQQSARARPRRRRRGGGGNASGGVSKSGLEQDRRRAKLG